MTKVGPLNIYPLTEDDISPVSDLYKLAITDAFESEGLGHLQGDIQQEIESKIRMAAASLNPPNSDIFFWVARIDGRVVGTISYAPCGEDIRVCTGNRLDAVGELGSLYVLPEYQGQGIGSALIAMLMVFLREQGITQFCLDSGYRRAQTRWLRKFGQPYAVVKDYWGPDSVHMVWLSTVS
ncbi:GCN5 family acetyltransferase [Paenibacillus borealis]|uniref:GCN5 family acetyltransferase n=1 Tax=Paenibacillus borealis TaxID=160799 RepID=A0A089LNT1_PAEBO|nr:GCN5 family acetyltransferase [Paenibacillus borealis]